MCMVVMKASDRSQINREPNGTPSSIGSISMSLKQRKVFLFFYV